MDSFFLLCILDVLCCGGCDLILICCFYFGVVVDKILLCVLFVVGLILVLGMMVVWIDLWLVLMVVLW